MSTSIDSPKMKKNDELSQEETLNKKFSLSKRGRSHSIRSDDASEHDPNIVARSSMGQPYYLFNHQVGGHKPFLRSAPGEVCKPAIPLELAFYQSLNEKFPQLKRFVPMYFGTIDVNLRLDGQSVEKNSTSQVKNNSKNLKDELSSSCNLSNKKNPNNVTTMNDKETVGFTSPRTPRKRKRRISNNTPRPAEFSLSLWKKLAKNAQASDAVVCQYIVLEDLTQGYNRPCVLDIKLGTRQHGDDASSAKRLSHTKKCKETTSYRLGLRLCGMQVFRVDSQNYLSRDKHWGRSLKNADIEPALKLFIYNGRIVRRDVLKELLVRLNSLKKVLAETKGVRFWGASLLLLYEGCMDKLSEHPHLDVRMIDFAHTNMNSASPTSDPGCELGLNNIIQYLERIENNTSLSETDTGYYLDVFPDE